MKRKIETISITILLLSNIFIITNFNNSIENASADGFPRDIFIEIHRIMELDEIDPGSGADWYFYVGVDDGSGSGFNWQVSNEPEGEAMFDNLNHLIVDKVFNFTVSSSPVSVAIYLCEDDTPYSGDDLADISSYPGEGEDGSTPQDNRGATCIVSYNLSSHSWAGDVNGSVSTGYSETNGEWDGADPGLNDAAIWFIIWDEMWVDITYPVFGVPLIQPKSDPFDIDLYLDNLTPPTSWNATILTEYDSCSLQINNITQNDAHNWTLTVKAPMDARYDLYDLKVEVDGVWDTEPHSISLINSFSSDFKFIHITDLHIDDPDVEDKGFIFVDDDDLVEADIFSSVIKEINFINPDFVIITGDVGDNPEGIAQNEVRQYEVAREVLLELKVPAFIISGNHDWRYDEDEEEYISIRTYHEYINRYTDFWFEYGNSRFVGLDSGWDVLLQGAGLWQYQIDYMNSVLPGHFPNFVFLHHTGIDDDGVPWLGFEGWNTTISNLYSEFLNTCAAHNVELCLSGHTHLDEVWDSNRDPQVGDTIGSPIPPLYIQTKSVTHNDSNNEFGYRLVRVSGGSVTNYTYDRDGNGQRNANSSIVGGNLNLTFSPSNNGTADTVTATIENDLHESFQDARIVFKMPKPDPGRQYYATNGWIEQKIECPTFDVYYVRTDIQNESTKDVILQQNYSIFLGQGWNLISIPLIQSDTHLGTVLSSIDGSYDAVQWYNVSDPSDPWKHNNTKKPSHLNDLDSIDHRRGFWIHITKPGGILFQYPGILPLQNQTITIHPGWNLIGYPSLTCHNRTEGLNNLTFGSDIDAIWIYNAAIHKWQEIGPTDYFEPGKGYWIHSMVTKTWIVPL